MLPMDTGIEGFGNTNCLNLLNSEFISSTEVYVGHHRDVPAAYPAGREHAYDQIETRHCYPPTLSFWTLLELGDIQLAETSGMEVSR